MSYRELTPEVYRELVASGYKYIEHGKQLTNLLVGFEAGTAFGHFEVIPHKEEPLTHGYYYDIGAPEVVDMCGSIDLVFYWIKE